MPSELIELFGPGASLDYRAGAVTARIEIEQSDDLAVDFERNRCQVGAMPGPDRNCWLSGEGLLLIARRGWWGVRVLEDFLPSPRLTERTEIEPARFRKRKVPRDLASCPTCRRLLVIRRAIKGPGVTLERPTVQLARSARASMLASGLMPFVIEDCIGRGRKGGRPHDLDCYPLPAFRPFSEPPKKKGRGRLRLKSLPFNSTARKVTKSASD